MNPWTPETDAKLRALFLAGKSDAAIATELGFSKNSVIGRRARINLRREAVRTRGIGDVARALLPGGKPDAIPAPRAAPVIGPAGSCKFIERDGPPFFADGDPYCGATVAAPGESWCEAHRARCFQPLTPKLRKAA